MVAEVAESNGIYAEMSQHSGSPKKVYPILYKYLDRHEMDFLDVWLFFLLASLFIFAAASFLFILFFFCFLLFLFFFSC